MLLQCAEQLVDALLRLAGGLRLFTLSLECLANMALHGLVAAIAAQDFQVVGARQSLGSGQPDAGDLVLQRQCAQQFRVADAGQ
ncbi:MAG: hypothetical protein ACLGH6_01380, partial [Gammaproteobacteria bacterium]